MRLAKCPYCELATLSEVVAKRGDGVPVIRCPRCGLMWAAEIPDNLNSYYNTLNYFKKTEECETSNIGYGNYFSLMPIDFLWQEALVRIFAGNTGGELLDLGCGTGRFLALAKDRLGFKTIGVELSRPAVELAQKAGLEVTHAAVEKFDLPPGKYVDVITAWDLFEHIIELRQLLLKCHKWLKPGGVLLFSTPNAGGEIVNLKRNEWSGFRFSLEHVLYLTPAFLHTAFKDTFGYPPILFSYTYGGDYSTLLGLCRKGGYRESDYERAQWLQYGSFPIEEELLELYGDSLIAIYTHFEQNEALERLTIKLKTSASLRLQQLGLMAEGILHFQRGELDEAIKTFEAFGITSRLDSTIWQWLAKAQAAKARFMGTNLIEKEQK